MPETATEYTYDQRVDDVQSMLAQLGTLEHNVRALQAELNSSERVADLLRVEEKAALAERAAKSLARDARLIFDRQGGESRWLGGDRTDNEGLSGATGV